MSTAAVSVTLNQEAMNMPLRLCYPIQKCPEGPTYRRGTRSAGDKCSVLCTRPVVSEPREVLGAASTDLETRALLRLVGYFRRCICLVKDHGRTQVVPVAKGDIWQRSVRCCSCKPCPVELCFTPSRLDAYLYGCLQRCAENLAFIQ